MSSSGNSSSDTVSHCYTVCNTGYVVGRPVPGEAGKGKGKVEEKEEGK